MSNANGDLQAVLYAGYVDQAVYYARALRLAGELSVACSHGEVIDDRLCQLLAVLGDIAEKDSLLAAAKQQWEREGKPTNDALSTAMNRIADLIQQLCGEWQTLERAVRVRRDQLAADLDGCNDRYRMQRAYQRES